MYADTVQKPSETVKLKAKYNNMIMQRQTCRLIHATRSESSQSMSLQHKQVCLHTVMDEDSFQGA